MKKIAYIDLDNIAFHNNHMDRVKLISRLEVIDKLKCNQVNYYCNKNTKVFIEKENIFVSKPIVLKTKKDSADHRIIHDVLLMHKKQKYSKIYIISNDKTFMRLAKFIVPEEQAIVMYQFKNTSLMNIDNSINICFKKKVDLDHFIESYNLFKQRYLVS